MNKPLEGYKVVELGTHVAVPIAARMMADWGAEVIKVEPQTGEPWRTIGGTYGVPCTPEHNPIFQNVNINKKAVAINLKSEEGREALLKLLSEADVFLTNTRPKSLQKLGLDYETLKEKYPKLIYGHLSGFGAVGPEKDRPGFDVAAFWSRGGMPVEWTQKEYPPFKPQAGFGDTVTGCMLLNGLLTALLGRAKTGKGDFIQISLFGAAIWCNNVGVVCVQPQYGLTFPRGKEDFTNPFNPIYQTKDGDWFMCALPDWNKRYKEMLAVLGLERYNDDPRFTTQATVAKHVPEIVDIFAEAFAKIGTDELVEKLTKGDFVFERLLNTRDVCNDEQAWANHYLRNVTLEDGSTVILPENPVQFSNFEPGFELAPLLGEDTKQVMQEIGYSASEVERMLESGAVK